MGRRVILDVSSNNGEHVPFAGIKALHPDTVGVFIKVIEVSGSSRYVNPYWKTQYAEARAAGYLIGFYGFMHPSAAGTADDQLLLDETRGYAEHLGYAIDCEVSDNEDPSMVSARFHEDGAYLESQRPGRIWLYTGRWFWDPQTRGSGWASGLRAWIANYSSGGPDIPFPWTHCDLWQFTDRFASAPGVTVDASYWLGSDADWTALTGKPAPLPPVPDATAAIRDTQQIVHAVVDGKWGKDTDRRCESLRAMRDPLNDHNPGLVRSAQATLEVPVDGDWGPRSQSSWTSSVKKLQAAWGVVADGVWGPGTDSAYLALSPTR